MSAFDRVCCQACQTPFLAVVAASRPTMVLPWAGDLAALSRGARLGWAAGCAVLAAILLVGLLALGATLL